MSHELQSFSPFIHNPNRVDEPLAGFEFNPSKLQFGSDENTDSADGSFSNSEIHVLRPTLVRSVPAAIADWRLENVIPKGILIHSSDEPSVFDMPTRSDSTGRSLYADSLASFKSIARLVGFNVVVEVHRGLS